MKCDWRAICDYTVSVIVIGSQPVLNVRRHSEYTQCCLCIDDDLYSW